MNQEYVYEFDLNGYVIIPAAIAWPHLRRLQTYRSDGPAATVGHRARLRAETRTARGGVG